MATSIAEHQAVRLAHAEAHAALHGLALTPLRRQVYAAIVASDRPIGAYELLDALEPQRGRVPPTTIYRALDFLLANGLVHRIESRNAFIACINNHASGSLVVFLICERCGAVGEAPATAVADALLVAASAASFVPKTPVIEITGVCAHCRTP